MVIIGMLFLLLFIVPSATHAQAAGQGVATATTLPMTVDKISADLFVIRGDGGNTSVYRTDEGIVLVDSKFELEACSP
jgi:hypothetical protein